MNKKPYTLFSNVDDLLEKYGDHIFDNGDKLFDPMVIDFLHMSIESGQKLKLRYRGKEIDIPESFWPSVSNTDGLIVERLLIAAGSKCLIDIDEVAATRSKIITYGRLAAKGIRIPKTLVFFHHTDREYILENLQPPFIVKPDNGFGGTGVELIHDEKEFDEFLSNVKPGIAYIAQEYISTSFGRDVRVVMLNGKYFYSAMRNSNNPDEFRSNVHQGGEMTDYPIDKETEALCEKVASLFNLPILGIDLLIGDNEYVVVEVNATPGGLPDDKNKEAYYSIIKSNGIDLGLD